MLEETVTLLFPPTKIAPPAPNFGEFEIQSSQLHGPREQPIAMTAQNEAVKE